MDEFMTSFNYCPGCGKKIENKSHNYCPDCGTKLSARGKQPEIDLAKLADEFRKMREEVERKQYVPYWPYPQPIYIHERRDYGNPTWARPIAEWPFGTTTCGSAITLAPTNQCSDTIASIWQFSEAKQ